MIEILVQNLVPILQLTLVLDTKRTSRQVAPGGQADLLQRADIDQGGTLSLSEFTVLGQLLGLETSNVQQIFGLLPLATAVGERGGGLMGFLG